MSDEKYLGLVGQFVWAIACKSGSHLFWLCVFYLTGMDDEDNDKLPLHEMLDDKLRVRYFKEYLASVAQAIK